ncbi:MAG: SGNH/GDSL hydrolase family protein [Phycisphaerae bacterium]
MLTKVSSLLARGEPVNIISYGDSISAVRTAPPYFGGASRAEMNWANQLGRLLGGQFPGGRFIIKPFGFGGQNAYEGLGRYEWLAALAPDLVLIALGGNDCGWHEIPPYCSAHAIKTLRLGIRHDFGADVVIMGPAGDCPAHGQMVHLDETIAALREVAAATDAPFVDIRAAVLAATDNGRLWTDFHGSLTDCHPNDKGHAVWATAVFDVLRRDIAC